MANKLKRPGLSGGQKIAAPPVVVDKPAEQNPPVFSLRYLQGDYCISQCTRDEKAAFAERMHRLSQLTWAQLKQAPRHGLGFEKIARHNIRAGIPAHVTPDTDLLAFRFEGLKPMVGYRRDSTFFVLWLDRDFTLYPHE